MSAESTAVVAEEKPLTKLEVVRAMTNDPSLAKRVVVLGDREFPIVDLGYDSYSLFMVQLQPLLQGMIGLVPGFNQFRTQASNGFLTPAHVIAYCGSSLPEMARIETPITLHRITPCTFYRCNLPAIFRNNRILNQIHRRQYRIPMVWVRNQRVMQPESGVQDSVPSL